MASIHQIEAGYESGDLPHPGWEDAGSDLVLPAAARKTVYRSGLEVFEAAPAEVPWIWHGYLAKGAVTLLAGRYKGGKSTLLFGLLRTMLDGWSHYVGHEVANGPVVILTEEGQGTLKDKLGLISEEGLGRLRVLCREDASPRVASWVEAVAEAGQEAQEHGADLVVIDTFAFWSQMRDENDNAVIQAAAEALLQLAATGVAVLVVHHHRKSGGEDGDAIRGGTGLPGVVDIIVELTKPKGDGEGEDSGRRREIQSIGRYPETPEAMLVQLDGDGVYRQIAEGSRDEIKQHSAREKLIAFIRDIYPETPTTKEAYEGAGIAKGGASMILRELVSEGRIERFEHGQQHRFRWVSETVQ